MGWSSVSSSNSGRIGFLPFGGGTLVPSDQTTSLTFGGAPRAGSTIFASAPAGAGGFAVGRVFSGFFDLPAAAVAGTLASGSVGSGKGNGSGGSAVGDGTRGGGTGTGSDLGGSIGAGDSFTMN